MADYAYIDVDRREMLPFVPPRADRVLDVGCGQGGFGASVKAAHPTAVVWGIEPDADAARRAGERLDHVIVGLYPAALPEGEAFDFVVFNDVLEHVVDPWGVLRRTQSLLRPGGCVVASIPNVRHWSVLWSLLRGGTWTYRDAGILDRTHLRFFTRSTLVDLFVGAGYRIDAIEPISETVRGCVGRFVALFGARTEEFRAVQYGIRATPVMDVGARWHEPGVPGAARAAVPVVMIHWEAPEWCRDAVAAFLASDGVDVDVTVVDNGGGPLELPAAGVRLVVPGTNTGFAGGANEGLRRWLSEGEGEYCVVASHDCRPEPGALAHLVAAAEALPTFGLLAPTFTDGDYGGKARGRLPGVVVKEWLSGSCLLVRRRCLEDIGLFDERMGSYSEDVDLALRAQDAGWSVGVVEAALASTMGSRLPIVERRRLGEGNAIYLLLKRRAWAKALSKAGAQLLPAARHALIGALRGERGRIHRQLAGAHLGAIRLGVAKARDHAASGAVDVRRIGAL